MQKLTPRQANVLDHALAYPKLARNKFVARPDTINDDTWRELVALEMAAVLEVDAKSNHTTYKATDKGIAAICEYHNELDQARADENSASFSATI